MIGEVKLYKNAFPLNTADGRQGSSKWRPGKQRAVDGAQGAAELNLLMANAFGTPPLVKDGLRSVDITTGMH